VAETVMWPGTLIGLPTCFLESAEEGREQNSGLKGEPSRQWRARLKEFRFRTDTS